MYKTIFQHQAERGIGIVKIEKFEEEKHPRDKGGKFSSGGGESGKGKEDKPESGKTYQLTGAPGEATIHSGASWKESEVKDKPQESITVTHDISGMTSKELKNLIPAGSYRGVKEGQKTVIRDGTNTRTFVWRGGKPILEDKPESRSSYRSYVEGKDNTGRPSGAV